MRLRTERIPVIDQNDPSVVHKYFLFFESTDGSVSLPVASDTNPAYIASFTDRFIAALKTYRAEAEIVELQHAASLEAYGRCIK